MNVFVKSGTSLQTVLNGLPQSESHTIHLEAGVYREKLTIRHSSLTIFGAGTDQTILTFQDAANQIHEDGLPMNTFRTPSVKVLSDHVSFHNLSIRNDAGLGKDVGQAVALSVYGDDFTATNCHFIAHQDTLFLGPLPVDLTERYKNFLPAEELHVKPLTMRFLHCLVEGDVDFIFGSATALFDECKIVCLGQGYLAAPSTYESNPLGLVFHRCQITSPDASARPFLARPWREHGMVLFVDCRFHGTFDPARFDAWNKIHHRLIEEPYVESRLGVCLDKKTSAKLLERLNQ
jgi:pectinesterase